MAISKEDFDILTLQLGRPPRGALEIMARDKDQRPAVIKVKPIVNKAPFPTLFWLTSELLKREISHLEKTGLIADLERDLIEKNKEVQEEFRQNHLDYQKERVEFLSETYPNWKSLSEDKIKVLTETGIGGIREFNHIKCLHLHYAHHLARKNIIGAYLDEHYQISRFVAQ